MDFRSRVRVLRALFLVSSDGKVLAAVRIRIIHRGKDLVALRDTGPCPIRCTVPE